MNRLILIGSISFLLLGCSSPPKTPEQFWYNQGESLGSLGYDIDNPSAERLKEKVVFDEASYTEGYQVGEEIYCDPHRAFEKGISGIQYQGQCAGIGNEVMTKAEWQRGWDAFIAADFYDFK